jgi:cytoskeletal protein CcmA (bactofilin family)
MDDKDKQKTEDSSSAETKPTIIDTTKEGGPSTESLDSTDASNQEATAKAAAEEAKKAKAKKDNIFKKLTGRLNIYLLFFILILIIAGLVAFVGYKGSQKEAEKSAEQNNLTAEQLDALKNSSSTVGDPKQTLNVESNAIFAGKVLVRDSLDVAGTIRVGGALALPGITVSGSSSFDEVKINNLAISGNTAIQGNLTVQKDLTVSGNATFGGTLSAAQLSIQNLQISNSLLISRHIDANGPTPGKTNGSALGGGGTVSVSGSDTAGTITVNTGSSPPAGCFVTITFVQAFSGTPNAVITPVGSSAAGLNYYINRSNTSMSVCTTNPPPAQTSFSFDYIVIN